MIILKTELIELLCNRSFKYSDQPVFKLVSGRMSQFYINCKPTTLSARGLFLTGSLVFEALSDLEIQGVGGLTFGADPIAVAAALISEIRRPSFNAFSIRKTPKDHGISVWIEGDMKPGDRVAIIDDVVTTGGSTIQAIERARSEGLDVRRVIVLVDRQEGGVENIRGYVDDVRTIVSRNELVERSQKRI